MEMCGTDCPPWDKCGIDSPPWDKCDMDSPHGTKVIKIVLMGQK